MSLEDKISDLDKQLIEIFGMKEAEKVLDISTLTNDEWEELINILPDTEETNEEDDISNIDFGDKEYEFDDYYTEETIDVYDEEYFLEIKKRARNRKSFFYDKHSRFDVGNLIELYDYTQGIGMLVGACLRNIKDIEKISFYRDFLSYQNVSYRIIKRYCHEFQTVLKKVKISNDFFDYLGDYLDLLLQIATMDRYEIRKMIYLNTNKSLEDINGDLDRVEKALAYLLGRYEEIYFRRTKKISKDAVEYNYELAKIRDNEYFFAKTLLVTDALCNHEVIASIYSFCEDMINVLRKMEGDDTYKILDDICDDLSYIDLKALGYESYTESQSRDIEIFKKNLMIGRECKNEII